MNYYTDRPRELLLLSQCYLFMQHTNLVIFKYVQPDLNLPEHQTEYDIETWGSLISLTKILLVLL